MEFLHRNAKYAMAVAGGASRALFRTQEQMLRIISMISGLAIVAALTATAPAQALDAEQKAWCTANAQTLSAALSQNFDDDWAAADDLDAKGGDAKAIEALHNQALNEMGASSKILEFYPGGTEPKPDDEAVKAWRALDHEALIKKADPCLPPNLQY